MGESVKIEKNLKTKFAFTLFLVTITSSGALAAPVFCRHITTAVKRFFTTVENSMKAEPLFQEREKVKEEFKFAREMLASIVTKKTMTKRHFELIVEKMKNVEFTYYPLERLKRSTEVSEILPPYATSLRGEEFIILLGSALSQNPDFDKGETIIKEFAQFAEWVRLSPRDIREISRIVESYGKIVQDFPSYQSLLQKYIAQFSRPFIGDVNGSAQRLADLQRRIDELTRELEALGYKL
jgi:hypothetical protein